MHARFRNSRAGKKVARGLPQGIPFKNRTFPAGCRDWQGRSAGLTAATGEWKSAWVREETLPCIESGVQGAAHPTAVSFKQTATTSRRGLLLTWASRRCT